MMSENFVCLNTLGTYGTWPGLLLVFKFSAWTNCTTTNCENMTQQEGQDGPGLLT